MHQYTSLQTASTYLVAIILLVFIMLSFVAGHQLRKGVIKRDPMRSIPEINPINGMLLGLLGLLLAFSFSMSNSRFDDRRHLIIEEADVIGTTILRTDMYPDSMRAALRSALRDYVERRIAFYETGTNVEKALSEYSAAQVESAKVWRMAVDYAKKDTSANTTRTSQLIPSINDMIDIASTRLAAGEGTIPGSIMYFLFALCLCASFLLGYERTGKVDWISLGGFALTLSITVFSILDLDRPRSGLIKMDGPNTKIIELREMFDK